MKAKARVAGRGFSKKTMSRIALAKKRMLAETRKTNALSQKIINSVYAIKAPFHRKYQAVRILNSLMISEAIRKSARSGKPEDFSRSL